MKEGRYDIVKNLLSDDQLFVRWYDHIQKYDAGLGALQNMPETILKWKLRMKD